MAERRSAAALPAACGGKAGQDGAGRSGPVQGSVLVLSYQTASPRWDMQQKLYDEFNEKHRDQRLQVEFVNPGQLVMDKARTLHAAGTPADMFEWSRLWRELDDLITDATPYFKRDKIDLSGGSDGDGPHAPGRQGVGTAGKHLLRRAGGEPGPLRRRWAANAAGASVDDRTWTMDRVPGSGAQADQGYENSVLAAPSPGSRRG